MAIKIPNVSLTYFLDFILKSGTPKLTVVANFKKRGEYDPQTDFYRQFRRKVGRALSRGESLATLNAWLDRVQEKKQPAYADALLGLRTFLGKSPLKWFEPPHEKFAIGPMVLSVNPELGLLIKGQPHVLKLYLKDEPLKSNRAEIVLHLMRQSLDATASGAKIGVLDARAGKFFSAVPKTRGINALLRGEAESFAAIYGEL